MFCVYLSRVYILWGIFYNCIITPLIYCVNRFLPRLFLFCNISTIMRLKGGYYFAECRKKDPCRRYYTVGRGICVYLRDYEFHGLYDYIIVKCTGERLYKLTVSVYRHEVRGNDIALFFECFECPVIVHRH